MIALWDTTGNEVVKALATERRNAGGVASGLALTLVAVVEEKRVREAETAAATAAAAHPCRLLIVVRGPTTATTAPGPESRLDAEIIVGGRLGPAEAVVMRMHGRLTRHAESVVIPLLAPDVPVVTWWHDAPPERIATDPLGVVAERRITDVAHSIDPIEALRVRGEDYAPGRHGPGVDAYDAVALTARRGARHRHRSGRLRDRHRTGRRRHGRAAPGLAPRRLGISPAAKAVGTLSNPSACGSPTTTRSRSNAATASPCCAGPACPSGSSPCHAASSAI